MRNADAYVRFLWVQTGRHQKTHRCHDGGVTCIAFGPNEQTLVGSSTDETIKIWDLASGACLNTLRVERPYERMNITDVTGLTDAQKATLKLLGAVGHTDSQESKTSLPADHGLAPL